MKLFFALLLLSPAILAQQLDPQAMRSEDIQQALSPHQYQTLLAGEKDFTVVIQDSTTVNTRGVAILVNDFSLGHMGSQSLAPLTGYLNDTGWVTVLMSAPDTELFGAEPASPVASPSTESNPESQTDADAEQTAPPATEQGQQSTPVKPNQYQSAISQGSFDNQELALRQQMTAVVPVAQRYPGFFLVISQGTSAAWLTKLYAEDKLGPPDALISIAPFWPDSQWNHQLSQYVGELPSPLLDIYNQWDNEWTRQSRKQRMVAAQKALKLHYRQREIVGQPLSTNQSAYLAKEIQGWLTQMGW
ncbi:DUF3530 family protein [Bowmanella denitrificans]|uniref:DUF3530 family protein n=1 Tax=Bowmanella denitrificans TaxID=366582 RepID=UPI000C9B5E07|nr:DUF3530 family protein [Bowmanella denitrificans]